MRYRHYPVVAALVLTSWAILAVRATVYNPVTGWSAGGGSAAFETHTEIIDTDANNSVTVTTPSGLSSGDIWVITCTVDNSDTITYSTPSGFTQIGSQWAGGDDSFGVSAAYYKVAGASESSATVTYTGTDFDAVCYSVRISGATGLDATGTPNTPTGASATTDAPDITIGANNSIAILVWTCVHSGNNPSGITPPSGTTAIDDRVGPSTYPATGIAYELVNSGSYTPGNWTSNGTNPTNRTAQTFSFSP